MPPKMTAIHQAKTNLSRLIKRAEQGEEVIIVRGKRPVVRLVAIEAPPKKRQLGMFRGDLEVGPTLFEPLSGDELDQWG